MSARAATALGRGAAIARESWRLEGDFEWREVLDVESDGAREGVARGTGMTRL